MESAPQPDAAPSGLFPLRAASTVGSPRAQRPAASRGPSSRTLLPTPAFARGQGNPPRRRLNLLASEASARKSEACCHRHRQASCDSASGPAAVFQAADRRREPSVQSALRAAGAASNQHSCRASRPGL